MNSPRKPKRSSTSRPDPRKTAESTKRMPIKTRSRSRVPVTPADPTFPMRINQYLAHKGYATRRAADELIAKGKVFVNGTLAKVGDKINETDEVEVRIARPRAYTYLAFNKPVGMNTHGEDGGDTIIKTLPTDVQRLKLFPIGRLDKNSHGLILLTNDGRVTDRVLNPKYDHEKVYEVRTKDPLRGNFKERVEAGVMLEGEMTKPARVAIIGPDRFRITLTEGKKHQIRRMVVALFNEVLDLKRVSIMNIGIDSLKDGEYRPLSAEESKQFLTSIGLV